MKPKFHSDTSFHVVFYNVNYNANGGESGVRNGVTNGVRNGITNGITNGATKANRLEQIVNVIESDSKATIASIADERAGICRTVLTEA